MRCSRRSAVRVPGACSGYNGDVRHFQDVDPPIRMRVTEPGSRHTATRVTRTRAPRPQMAPQHHPPASTRTPGRRPFAVLRPAFFW